MSGPLLSKTWFRLSGTPPPEWWRIPPPPPPLPPPPPPPPERWLRPRMRFMFILCRRAFPLCAACGSRPRGGPEGLSPGQPQLIGVASVFAPALYENPGRSDAAAYHGSVCYHTISV